MSQAETSQVRESDMTRVAIVDDHPIARRGIEQVFADSGTVTVVASVGSAVELAQQLADDDTPPDTIVLDLYHDGDEPCLAAVAELSRGCSVLVVSASGRPEDVVGAIRAGASGYVTKHASPQMLLAAVETVAAGGFALSSQLADILRAGLARSPRTDAHTSGTQALSTREEETLDLIAQGFTHQQVAGRMGVSKATVNTYVERIRAKLQVGNKAELTRAALERLGGTAPP